MSEDTFYNLTPFEFRKFREAWHKQFYMDKQYERDAFLNALMHVHGKKRKYKFLEDVIAGNQSNITRIENPEEAKAEVIDAVRAIGNFYKKKGG